jgi:predicted phosphodiesterase
MTVNYISDLHVDFFVDERNPENPRFSRKHKLFVDSLMPHDTGDILIIAGDLGHYNIQTFEVLEHFQEYYKEIYIVHGNHDLYLLGDKQTKRYEWESSNRVKELKDFCDNTPGLYYLDGDIVETTDGIRIAGAPGWYDLRGPGELGLWKQFLNDSNYIYDGYPIAGAYSYGARGNPNWDTNAFYIDQFDKLANIALEGCDILVNHVAQVIPPDDVIPEMYHGDPNNIFYYVDNFDYVSASGCTKYIYGHTHDIHHWEKDGIEFFCKPLGDPCEAK